jgi:DnaK suppressor protein
MKRLEEGTYGRCEVCGAPLSAGQLEAEPAASLCPACR